MTVFRGSTKAGRAWIEAVLAAATSVVARERDLITDSVTSRELWRDTTNGREGMPATLRAILADRYVEMYDIGKGTYYVLSNTTRVVIRYEILTYAFDCSDLPEVKPQ